MHTPCPHPERVNPAFAVTSVNVPSRLLWNSLLSGRVSEMADFKARAVDQEDIQPPIVVVVDKCDARPVVSRMYFLLVSPPHTCRNPDALRARHHGWSSRAANLVPFLQVAERERGSLVPDQELIRPAEADPIRRYEQTRADLAMKRPHCLKFSRGKISATPVPGHFG